MGYVDGKEKEGGGIGKREKGEVKIKGEGRE